MKNETQNTKNGTKYRIPFFVWQTKIENRYKKLIFVFHSAKRKTAFSNLYRFSFSVSLNENRKTINEKRVAPPSIIDFHPGASSSP